MYLLFFCFTFSIYDYYFSFSELFQVRTCELAYSYAPVVVVFFFGRKEVFAKKFSSWRTLLLRAPRIENVPLITR